MKPGLELPARKRTQAEADAILDERGALAWHRQRRWTVGKRRGEYRSRSRAVLDASNAAELLRGGATIAEVARATGVQRDAVTLWAKRSPTDDGR